MNEYVGLDVSLDVAHFCIVDESGAVVARGPVMHETGGLAR